MNSDITYTNFNKHDTMKMWDDIVKFLTIGTIMHLLFYFVDDKQDLFDGSTLKIFLYIIIGLIAYHLVIKKFVFSNILKIKNNKFEKSKE